MDGLVDSREAFADQICRAGVANWSPSRPAFLLVCAPPGTQTFISFKNRREMVHPAGLTRRENTSKTDQGEDVVGVFVGGLHDGLVGNVRVKRFPELNNAFFLNQTALLKYPHNYVVDLTRLRF